MKIKKTNKNSIYKYENDINNLGGIETTRIATCILILIKMMIKYLLQKLL